MLHIQLYRARRDHARFSLLIQMEQDLRRPDPARLAEYKKKRLAAKDRIARLLAAENPEPAIFA